MLLLFISIAKLRLVIYLLYIINSYTSNNELKINTNHTINKTIIKILGLIEADEKLFMSGWVKPIYDDDPGTQGCEEMVVVVEMNDGDGFIEEGCKGFNVWW